MVCRDCRCFDNDFVHQSVEKRAELCFNDRICGRFRPSKYEHLIVVPACTYALVEAHAAQSWVYSSEEEVCKLTDYTA